VQALDLRGVDGDRRRAAVHAEQLLRDQARRREWPVKIGRAERPSIIFA
jgi:hypothetical protein